VRWGGEQLEASNQSVREELDSAVYTGESARERRSLNWKQMSGTLGEGVRKGSRKCIAVVGGGMVTKVVWRKSGIPAKKKARILQESESS